jgi:septum formation protein
MLHQKLQQKNIILASGSPRRQALLKGLDIPFEIKLKPVNEVYDNNLKEEKITNYLASLKASVFSNELTKNDILITSDTIVWNEKGALEKPQNKREAIAMIQSLSNKTHKVITSVCLKSVTKEKVFHSLTEVSFKKLSLQEIEYYVEKYKPYDKAGAYGIQEWIGFIGVTKINGSYFNVMGLPVNKLYEELLKF